MNKKFIIPIVVCLSLVAIPLWLWVIVPQLTKLPKDFTYRADIVSLDNFYDEVQQKFSGDKRSVTVFSYKVTEQKQGISIIKNIFDVHKITGEKIFSVERFYGINPKTGKHIGGFGDRDRDGYLFAPRHLKKGEPFTYWHINYDGPGQMTFAGEETILGLPVYRYETHYEGVKIDQTKNLTNLPGVGTTQGVELEPYLQLWIEPVSGHLVKYKDDTIAYYYDLKTGERLSPWNHFSNTYTFGSVLDQVESAKEEKSKFILIDFVVPALLALLAIFVILFYYSNNKAVKILSLGILVTGVLIGIGMWFLSRFTSPSPYTGSVEKLRVGVYAGPLSSPIFIADQNGYFKTEGLDVEVTDFNSGKEALSAMLTLGNLDMATVAQTPVVLNSFDRNDYAVMAVTATSSKDNKILVRKDRNIYTALDLKGKRVGTTKGTTGHYLLGLSLSQHGLSLSDVNTVDMLPALLPQAITEGKVDAISSWEPYIYTAKKALGDNALLVETKDAFREDLYFVVFKDWAKNNPARLERFLVAIDKAETFIAEHPTESQRIVAERLKLDPVFMSSVWSDYSFGLFLDQTALLGLEQQARWLQTNKIVNTSTTLNYLDFIYFDTLEAAKPGAVTIIH